MAAISEVLKTMDGIVDYAAGMKPRESYHPHPAIQSGSVVEGRDINRSAYEALKESISGAIAKQKAAENPVKDYEEGKTSFQDMLRKLGDTSEDTRITEIYLQKKSNASAHTYTAKADKSAQGASGTLVDMHL
ncbi:MAG: hypothetical protein E7200_03285 [Selenomonas ruminantium]|nr:hypothetical protein [Selenomonas ruminantium]